MYLLPQSEIFIKAVSLFGSMIRVWEFDPGHKEVKSVDPASFKVAKAMGWIDCYKPTDEEFHLLAEKTGIPFEDLKSSIDSQKRPRVLPYDGSSSITFRAPYNDQGIIATAPVGIFLFKNNVLTIHDKPLDAINKFRELPDSQRLLIYRLGAPHFVYRFMDMVINDFFSLVDQIEDRINHIEAGVLQEASKLLVREIFTQKRVLIYIHKALVANKDVVSSLEKRYIREFRKEDIRLLRDLYNDVAQLIDLVSTYRDILTSILDMYLSSVSNNLNKVMKTLTLISAFVMVPTLISGIYGMNFRQMPELTWQYGYGFSLGLMVFSIVIFYVYFKRKGWIGWP
jgi:magnesium transporter